MADQTEPKGDAAAQKANEGAVAEKSGDKPAKADTAPEAAAKPAVKAADAKATEPGKAAPVKTEAKAEAAAKPKKAAPRKKAPAAKTVATKAAPAKSATGKKKTTAKKITPKSGAKRTATTSKPKDTTMATKTETKNIASDMANEMQTRLAGMYEKGTEMTGEMVTFQRANAEAMAEASKILFTGMQDLTRTAVEESRKAAGQMNEDARLMAAAKSPTELVKLQGDIVRRSFDHAVATSSKNTEAWIKLTNEAFAPLTSRMSETVDKMNKLAA